MYKYTFFYFVCVYKYSDASKVHAWEFVCIVNQMYLLSLWEVFHLTAHFNPIPSIFLGRVYVSMESLTTFL